MKKYYLSLFIFLCSMYINVVRVEPITNKEYLAIVDTAYHDFNGAAKGDQTLLAKAFDSQLMKPFVAYSYMSL